MPAGRTRARRRRRRVLVRQPYHVLDFAQLADTAVQRLVLADAEVGTILLLQRELVVEKSVQEFVGKFLFCVVVVFVMHHLILRIIGSIFTASITAGVMHSCKYSRSARRARHSRLITVPMGIFRLCATST